MNRKPNVVIYKDSPDLIGSPLIDETKVNVIKLSEQPDYEFKPGERYLVLWLDGIDNEHQPYRIITKEKEIHLGPRNENHTDITKMKYLITRSGIIFKFIYPRYKRELIWLTKEQYDLMEPRMDKIKLKFRNASIKSGISKKNNKPWYRLDYSVLSDQSDEVHGFLYDENFITDYPKLDYWRVIRTNEDIDNAFDYFMRTDQLYGLDYETNNFPFDSEDFYPMGVSIVGQNGIAAYFDMEWMDTIGHNLDHYLKRYQEFLEKYWDKIYTYNVSFEMRVTYLLFRKLYNFHEASTINVCDGFNGKKYSLKWSSQRCLGVPSWDDDFDYLCDKLHYLMLGIYGKKGECILKECTPDTYQDSDIWKEICEKYPDDLDEFRRLISMYWGKPFMCIPSPILGKYCCLDSFHTVLLRVHGDTKYDDRCWSCYDNNLRLAALLGIHGGNINIAHRDRMMNVSINLVIAARVKVLKYWTDSKSRLVQIPDLGDSPVVRMLKYGYNIFDSKQYLPQLLAPTESGLNDTALINLIGRDNYDKLREMLKPLGVMSRRSFRQRTIFDEIDNYFKELYHYSSESEYKNEFDTGAGHQSFDYSMKELIDHYYYLRLIDELKFLEMQIKYDDKPHKYYFREVKQYQAGEPKSINSPKAIELLCEYESKNNDIFKLDASYDQNWIELRSPDEIINYMSNIYNLQSPASHPDIRFMILNDYKSLYLNLCKMKEGDIDYNVLYDESEHSVEYKHEYVPLMRIDQSDVVGNYLHLRDLYTDLINKYQELFDCSLLKSHNLSDPMMDYWRYYQLDHDPARLMHAYWARTKELINLFKKEKLNDIATAYEKFNGLLVNENRNIIDEYLWLTGHFDYHMSAQGYDKMTEETREKFIDEFWNTDTTKRSIMSFTCLNICNKMHKKYVKIQGTYLSGHFSKFNRFVNDIDENLVCTERYHTGDYHQTDHQQIYFPYQELSCKSKRWSSPFHTIPSRSECKVCLRAPKGYLISYFDISGAEVRGISYTAPCVLKDGTIDPTRHGDEYMVDCYSKRIDPYINLAQNLEPGKDKWYYKGVRSTMKTILLGLLYGMGVPAMATSAEVTEARAEEVRDTMFANMRGIAYLKQQKGQYCVDHQGLVETALGDVLDVGWDPDRWERLGINQYVQNFSAVALGDGFYNNIRESQHSDKVHPIIPVGVIHDSSQNYFVASDIFNLYSYYREHLTEYLKKKYFGVDFLFDLEVGKDFFNVCEVKDIDDHTLELEGNYTSLKGLFEGLDEAATKYKIESFHDKRADVDLEIPNEGLPEGFKPKIKKTYLEQFIDGGYEARYWIDKSKYIVVIKKID